MAPHDTANGLFSKKFGEITAHLADIEQGVLQRAVTNGPCSVMDQW